MSLNGDSTDKQTDHPFQQGSDPVSQSLKEQGNYWQKQSAKESSQFSNLIEENLKLQENLKRQEIEHLNQIQSKNQKIKEMLFQMQGYEQQIFLLQNEVGSSREISSQQNSQEKHDCETLLQQNQKMQEELQMSLQY